jgi:hypothetical protein
MRGKSSLGLEEVRRTNVLLERIAVALEKRAGP